MAEKQMTEQESLHIIQQMIQTAKREQKDDGKGWIIWGWLLFLASVFTYVNLKKEWFEAFFFWDAFGILSIVLLSYESIRYFLLKKRERVRTYTKELFQKLNIGFFIFLMLIIFSINMDVDPKKGFALLLGLYGFWILIYGTVLDFKASVFGAYIVWGFAFASLFAKDFETTMLLHAAAVLCGYIIPGHIAYKEFIKVGKEATKTSV